MADIVKEDWRQWTPKQQGEWGSYELRNPFVCQQWYNSLGCTFLQLREQFQNTPRDDLLQRLFQKSNQNNQKNQQDVQHTTVVHVRVGDVMNKDSCYETNGCYWKHGTGIHQQYVYGKRIYEQVLAHIPTTNRILVIGSPHHVNPRLGDHLVRIQRSEKYIQQLVDFFRTKGHCTTYQGDDVPPDKAFLAMARSVSFVQGGGGFSEMAGILVKMNGGTVIDIPKMLKEKEDNMVALIQQTFGLVFLMFLNDAYFGKHYYFYNVNTTTITNITLHYYFYYYFYYYFFYYYFYYFY